MTRCRGDVRWKLVSQVSIVDRKCPFGTSNTKGRSWSLSLGYCVCDCYSIHVHSANTIHFQRRQILPILLVTRRASRVKKTIQMKPKSIRRTSEVTVELGSETTWCLRRLVGCCCRCCRCCCCWSLYAVAVKRVVFIRSRRSSTLSCSPSAGSSQWKSASVGVVQLLIVNASTRPRSNLTQKQESAECQHLCGRPSSPRQLHCVPKKCAKLFSSEHRQISANFDN